MSFSTPVFSVISITLNFKELRKNRLIIASFLGLMIYFLFLVVSISWVDFAIPFDNRLLAPASFFLTLFLSTTLFFSLKKYNHILYPLFVFLCGIYLLGNLKKAHIFWEKYRNEGEGYNSSFFEPIPEEVLTRFCENKTIYTNNPGAVKLSFPNSCSMVQPLPLQYIEINNQVNPDFTEHCTSIKNEMKNKSAAIVLVKSAKISGTSLESLDLSLIQDTSFHFYSIGNSIIYY